MSHDGEIHLFEPRRRKDLAESDKGSNVPLYAWSDSRRRGSVADGHQTHRAVELQKNRATEPQNLRESKRGGNQGGDGSHRVSEGLYLGYGDLPAEQELAV